MKKQELTIGSVEEKKERRVKALWILMLVGAFYSATNGLMFMFIETHGDPVTKHRMLEVSPIIGYLHLIGGVLATLIGPFQFLDNLRLKNVAVHRWLGRIYLVCVFASAIGGLYLSKDTFAFTIGDIGFALLAIFWAVTGYLSYTTIKRGEVMAHRKWMVRNYALTYAAVMLRIYTPILMLGVGLSVQVTLTIVAYMCWVPNLFFVEWYQRKYNLKKWIIK